MTGIRNSSIAALALAGAAIIASTGPAAAQVDPNLLLDQFEATFGKFEGYRRAGAKGICAAGEFTGSADGRALSVSSAFSGKTVPVIVRFSVGGAGANPKAADNARSQRNMALEFNLPDGETWQMGNISAPVFGAATLEQFLGRLQSLQPDPVTKVADPAKVKAFADVNPEVLLQGRYLAAQPVPASFGTVNYWGVHAFAFVNSGGHKNYGKWIFEPVGGIKGLSEDEAKAKGPSFLFDELRERVAAGGVAFDFNLQLAERGDLINSAVVPLPDDRRKVNLGRLVIKSVAADAGGNCVAISFSPMLLPMGVEPSDDPMLAARAAAYVVGLGRRLGEGAKQ
jgi:catalase